MTFVIGFLSIGLMVLFNIILVSYQYGQLKAKVNGLGQRVVRLEGIQDSEDADRRRANPIIEDKPQHRLRHSDG